MTRWGMLMIKLMSLMEERRQLEYDIVAFEKGGFSTTWESIQLWWLDYRIGKLAMKRNMDDE